MTSFQELGVDEHIVKAIERLNITEPNEIQVKSLPSIIEGKDVIAQSATGSGKTLAFGLGLIQNLQRSGFIQVIVLTPTRELAIQVSKVLKSLSTNTSLRYATIYGGVAINPQMKALQDADVVVGTPGRVLDHLERQTMDLSHVSTFVIDEADRMLDMGFIIDVEKIIKTCPLERQTLLFSATMPSQVENLARKYMNNPLRISAKVHLDISQLSEVYYNVTNPLKVSLLIHLLKKEGKGIVMVFCNTRQSADVVAHTLREHDIPASAIHGGLTQAKRTKMLESFHSGKINILVCTDVAARGLDIKDVSHIYNFDIPKDSTEYTHRIGRTAREGKDGKIINILSDRDHDNFSRILQQSRKDIRCEITPELPNIRVDWRTRRSSDSRGPSRGPQRFSSHGGRPGSGHGPHSSGARYGGSRPGGSRHGGSRHSGSRPNGPRRSGPRR